MESARLHFLGGCLRYDTDNELLTLLSTDEVAQLLRSIANANARTSAAAAAAAAAALNASDSQAVAAAAVTEAPFPDEATLQELEERRERRARVRAARLASATNNNNNGSDSNGDNFLKTAVMANGEEGGEEGNDLNSNGEASLQQSPSSKTKRTVKDLREAKKRTAFKSGVGALQAAMLMGGVATSATAAGAADPPE